MLNLRKNAIYNILYYILFRYVNSFIPFLRRRGALYCFDFSTDDGIFSQSEDYCPVNYSPSTVLCTRGNFHSQIDIKNLNYKYNHLSLILNQWESVI